MPPTLFRSVPGTGSSRRAGQLSALPLSVAVHIVILLALVVIPLVATDTLPIPYHPLESWMPVVAPPAPPPARPPALPRSSPPTVDESRLAPIQVPTGIRPESSLVTEPAAPSGLETRGDVVDGGFGVVNGAKAIDDAPPPPAPTRPRQLTSDMRRPVRTVYVEPIYPEVARQARVEGIVIIEATISRTGEVLDARVLRSQPLLNEPALAAVRQWKFTPALLNGTPLPVIMTVTVTFSLH